MKIFVLLILFLVMGFLFKSQPAVLSTQISISPTPTISIVTATSIPSSTPRPTGGSADVNTTIHVSNSTSNSTNATNSQVKITVEGADWQYPGSANDSAQTITDWFVNKIKDMHLSTTSFVKTNANGQVLNCLVAAGNGAKVKVQISQNSNSNCNW